MSNTSKHFEEGKHFNARIKPEHIDFLNDLFLRLGINADLPKSDQFIQFAQTTQALFDSQTSDTELSKKLEEAVLEIQTLKSDKIELQTELQTAQTELQTAQTEIQTAQTNSQTGNQETQTRVEELEQEVENLNIQLSAKPDLPLAPNEVLFKIPPFHFHILSKVAASRSMKRFNEKRPSNNALYIKYENFEDKKEVMASTLLNSFVGVFLIRNERLAHLPSDFFQIINGSDIEEARTYAKKQNS